MTLRTKILLICGLVSVASALVGHLVQRHVVYAQFLELERQKAIQDAQRCREAVLREMEHLVTYTADWAFWDETWRFMADRNPAYIEANITTDAMVSGRFNLLRILDRDRSVVIALDCDFRQKRPLTIPEVPRDRFPEHHPLLSQRGLEDGIVDVLDTACGPLLLGSCRVLTTSHEGPDRGWLVLGRLLDEATLEQLRAQTKVRFDVRPAGDPSLSPAERGALAGLEGGAAAICGELSDTDRLVYTAVAGASGPPALLIRARSPRDISTQGGRAVRTATLSMAAASAGTLLVLLLLLSRFVAEPVRRLTRRVESLGRDGPVGGTSPAGRDEITVLTRELNAMIERLGGEQALRLTNAYLERARDAAETASRAKTEFLANISHEIRTPMTAILGFADVFLENPHTDPRQADAARTIRRNGQRLLQIIDNILDLSHAEAGQLEIRPEPCSPAELAASVVSELSEAAGAKGLALSIERAGAVPATILTDPRRLRQVLAHLVGNAIKFTESGQVRVILGLANEPDGPRLCMDVIDTGIGMDPAGAEELFEPFRQADSSLTRRFGGAGLGLAVGRRLARAMGGDITIVRTAPGSGTHVRLTVDPGRLDGVEMLAEAAPETRPSAAAAAGDTGPAQPLAGLRVLLAEDGEDNRRLLSAILRKAGAEVDLVEDGQAAVDQVLGRTEGSGPYDVVLMDMQMPVMDGYHATRRLREAGYGGRIVAVTAHAMTYDRALCLAAGCDEYLAKPVDRRRLVELVRKAAAVGSAPT